MHHRFEIDQRFYEYTMWSRWEERARIGLDADLERIQHDAAVGIGSDVRVAWIADETAIANALTDAMFASLVVTIWSEMEHFLEGLIEECQARLGQPVHAPFKFGQIMTFFNDHTGVDLTTLADFQSVDAVRILDNSFKHSDGIYSPVAGQAHTSIDAGLLAAWDIVDASNRINYAKLPFEDLVMASGRFANDLAARTAGSAPAAGS